MIMADWDGKASNNDGTHAETMYVLNTAMVNGMRLQKQTATEQLRMQHLQ